MRFLNGITTAIKPTISSYLHPIAEVVEYEDVNESECKISRR